MDDSTLPPEGSIERKRLQFISRNSDLPWQSEKGVEIAILPAPWPQEGRLQIAIVLDDDTGTREVSDAYRLASQWRARLISFQGPRLDNRPEIILEQIERWKAGGKRPRVIAEWLNKQIQQEVKAWTLHKNALESEGTEFVLGMPYANARMILEALKYENSHEWLMKSFQDHRQGIDVTSAKQPIDGDKVKERLKDWKKRKKRMAK